MHEENNKQDMDEQISTNLGGVVNEEIATTDLSNEVLDILSSTDVETS